MNIGGNVRKNGMLPDTFGINISPIVKDSNDIRENIRSTTDAVEAFVTRDVIPSWFTLNISCPNVDFPIGITEFISQLFNLCTCFTVYDIPLWVKIPPYLDMSIYKWVVDSCLNAGAKAIIATNTTRDGIGGERLRFESKTVVRYIMEVINENEYDLDVIACGGIFSESDFDEYEKLGAKAGQYCSAWYIQGGLQ